MDHLIFYLIWPVYEITVAPMLKQPGTLLKRLRNINVKDCTQFKPVSRHPGVKTKKQTKLKWTIEMWCQNLDRKACFGIF